MEDLRGSNKTVHLHAAEEHGINFGDCNKIYNCPQSPLEHLTILEHKEDDYKGGS